MATSVFFSTGSRQEKNLYEDIVIESLKVYGQDVYYLPRQSVVGDLNNEASVSYFNDAYLIEMYIENTGGFEGDGTLMSKFGLEIRDQANFIVARRTYEKLVAQYDQRKIARFGRPFEGDLIYFPLTKSLFEIKFVNDRVPFYQLNNVTMYTLQCELFEYSNERFGTGVNDIDILQTTGSINSTVLSVKAGTGTQNARGDTPVFAIGEPVIQALGVIGLDQRAIYAEVGYMYADPDPNNAGGWVLNLNGISTTDGEYHTFKEDVRLVGQSSGASWVVHEVKQLNDPNPANVMPYTQEDNREFEIEGDSIIDFSESNPFGDISIAKGIEYFSTPSDVVSFVGLFLVSATTTTIDSNKITVDKY